MLVSRLADQPVGERARADRAIVAMAFADALGTGTYLAGSVVFFTKALDLSAAQVGLGLSVGALLGIATSMPIGMAADHFGPRRTMIVICAWRAAGFACYGVIHGFAQFMLVTCLLGLAGKAAMASVRQALVARAVRSESRVATMAVTQAVRNVAFGLGSLLAFAFVQVGARASYDLIVLVNALSFVVAGMLASTVRQRNPISPKKPRHTAWSALTNRRYLAVAVLSTVFQLNQSFLVVALPLWTLAHTSAPRALVPVFLTLNTVLVALLQVRTSRLAKTVPAAARALMTSGALLASACALVAAASGPGPAGAALLLVLAVVAITGCELLQSTASWQLSYALAPEEGLGSHLGLFGMSAAAEGAIGPYALTSGVIASGIAGWVTFAVLLCAAVLAVPAVVPASPREATEP
jgi:MFS family permease